MLLLLESKELGTDFNFRISALDEKKEMGVIAIDLSKAFDCICHNLLLAKVKAYGVQEPALQLLRSYLHGRKQRVIQYLPAYKNLFFQI